MILFFHLHFTWLNGSWYQQRILKKLSFWKYESWFSSEVSKLTSAIYPWNNTFSGMKKMILNNNNVIDFDPIKIQTCLAPHNDRQHLLFLKDIYVDAKKMTTKCPKWPFLKLKFSKKNLPKLKNTIFKPNCDLCCSSWSN